MANIIYDEVRKYLDGLAATNTVCSALGTTLTAGTNLFIGSEPDDVATCCTIIPYGGAPPSQEGDKQEGTFQIRLKTTSMETGLKTQQAAINLLHNNTKVCASTNGRVSANQSAPITLGYEEAGEYPIVISNYSVRYIKI